MPSIAAWFASITCMLLAGSATGFKQPTKNQHTAQRTAQTPHHTSDTPHTHAYSNSDAHTTPRQNTHSHTLIQRVHEQQPQHTPTHSSQTTSRSTSILHTTHLTSSTAPTNRHTQDTQPPSLIPTTHRSGAVEGGAVGCDGLSREQRPLSQLRRHLSCFTNQALLQLPLHVVKSVHLSIFPSPRLASALAPHASRHRSSTPAPSTVRNPLALRRGVDSRKRVRREWR